MCRIDINGVLKMYLVSNLALGHDFRKNVNSVDSQLMLFCADVKCGFRFPTISNERSGHPNELNHCDQFLEV